MNIRKNFFWLIVSKSSIVLAGVITGALINRSLGPSGRGFFAEIQTWVNLFVMFFGFSIDTVIYHFANEKQYGSNAGTKFVTFLVITLFLGLASALFLLGSIYCFPEFFSYSSRRYVFLLMIIIIFTLIFNNEIAYVQAIGEIKFSAIIGLIQSLANIVFIVVCFCLSVLDLFYVTINLVFTLSILLAVLACFYYKKKYWRGNFSFDLGKKIILAGFQVHLATISTFVYMKINQLLLFNTCGDIETGYYAVSLGIAQACAVVPNVLQIILFPRLIHSNDEYEVTIRFLRYIFYGWGIIVVFIIILADPILRIYAGSKFLPAINVFRIIMLSLWLNNISATISPFWVKKGKFIIASVSAIIVAIVSIFLNYNLVPVFHALGAALSTFLSCFFGFLISLLLFYYLSKRNPILFMKINFVNEFSNIFRLKK